MNSVDWPTRCSQYLTASVAWLRLRLERLAAPIRSAPAKPPADDQVAQAQQARDQAAQIDPPPPLLLLSRLLGLSNFERDILLLCAALELDTRLPALCAQAQAEPQRPYPTFALALALFDEPRWDALSPERPLRYWRLIEITQPAATPLTLSALRADERIVNYLQGLNHLDSRLTAWLTLMDRLPRETLLAPSQDALAQGIVEHLKRARPRLPVVGLVGTDRASKQGVARTVADRFGRQLCRLNVESLPAQLPDMETLARVWQRENQLLPLALYIDAHSAESHWLETNASFKGFLARDLGLVLLDLREAPADLSLPLFVAEVAKPLPSEQHAAWASALSAVHPAEAGPAADLLAGQFSLNIAAIHEMAQTVSASSEPVAGPLWEACRAATRPPLDQLAQRLEPRADWDHLVLPEEARGLLREIACQVQQRHTVYETWGFARQMSRGLGLSALFAGESGTGKTMAAEVIAHELHLSLYRIDLSAVVSKYIGETEKNLRQLFDAAEDGGAILFFDEADALFGKRSEVKDSHDRYANIEINYLLQRMEAYRGLAILATNLKSALDPAFMRRLRFIVNFPFPGQAERKAIWQAVFPPETPQDPLDWDRLARLNLTGGLIHNIALNAAFMAAHAKGKVTTALVLRAARTELRKLDRPFNEADFR